ncbi:NAD-dependent epimerase/dehydratase family protein [Sphingobacterium sp. CZ-2]|uniref:NAD-dependent epimerase/dehydratase family protein n=1 Tax=Sphingobacterium sp. CZ-2 TaxID=2557994 RepID=UPI00106F640C|nr:NAD-dependent epimerase/dehydratase family protein [Sphingobacterium sp. CZ-2]QBR13256.1 NAD-dependent epimerase/dehydratase family protein [Sphingobacterium sp. CZ-2]
MKQTILGANGQIAEELVKELKLHYTNDIRLVSRNPKKVHETDELFPANLLDAEATSKAVEGSDIAYLTVGLPMNSQMWIDQFPIMMRNVIDACKKHDTKLVFFDNTYMYPKTSEPQTEETSFQPNGPKSSVRAEMANMLLEEMKNKQIEAVICRAPEFYGTGKTQSITNGMIFEKIAQHKKLIVPIKDNTRRTLIWTPDASRAMALIGNTPDAYGQTWHLPCDDQRMTYKEIIDQSSQILQRKLPYKILSMLFFKFGSLFNNQAKELLELLPRYKYDNIFVSDKFKKRFPEFKITSYQEGIKKMINPSKQ